jgi:arylsulfatase A-like enzyme
MRGRGFVLPGLLLAAGCAREAPPRGPQRLLALPAEGRSAVSEVEAGGQKRRALVSSARYRLYLPRRALFVFSLAAPARSEEAARGFFHLRLRADGKDVGERRINVRTERAFRATSLAFDGPGRTGRLELELALLTGSGEPLPVPPELTLAVVDPMLLDLSALGQRRGVVLISIDTLRRDHVGLYGYPKPTTPRLDALGREGIVFDDAVSVSSWTLPAHFSMMTAVDPAAHGAVDSKHAFNHRFPTLGRVFREAGFLTHAITSHLYVSREYGFDDGFDGLDYAYDRKGRDVAERALRFLDGVDERPFFLFLHFYDPHWHYDPPKDLLRIFEPEPYTGAISGNWWKLKTWTKASTGPADLAHLLTLYDGEIRYADGQLARVLDRLAERGLEQTTLVVVTSDHGEEFLEHGGWEHQRTLYEELLRIPLVLRGPGVPAGRRVATQVTLLDLAPTVLDWAGLPSLPTQRGRSLLRALDDREAYGETDHGPGDTRKLFLRGGASQSKLILTFDRKTDALRSEEWYDLERDPGETRCAAPPEATSAASRDRLLKRWQEARRLGAGGLPVDLTPEQLEQLRALGYIQ